MPSPKQLLCFKLFAKCFNFKISTLNQPSKSKHLKAWFGPRVRDVTFFNHGGRLGPRVHNMTFLDALASLRSMLESHRVINVFEIVSNLGLIIRVCSEYVQGMLRVCSGCVQSVLRVCSECVQIVFRVCPECVQSVYKA